MHHVSTAPVAPKVASTSKPPQRDAGHTLVAPVDLGTSGSAAHIDHVVELLTQDRAALKSRLLAHGALLLPRVEMKDPGVDFGRLSAAFAGTAPVGYVGGDSPRTRVGGNVYTSTEMPPDVPIGLHNELSYTTRYPRFLFFYCLSPAESGGESMLADSGAVFNALDPSVRERFMRDGIRYMYAFPSRSRIIALANRVVPVNKTWNDVYETDDPREAEERCRAIGMEPQWEEGRLVAHATLPAAIPHAETGEMMWFNQAHLFELSARAIGWWRYAQARAAFLHPDFRTHGATHGDGTPFAARALEHIHDVLEAQTVSLAMKAGDVLIMDNLRCMHGRRPFRGNRKLLVSMTS